MKVTVQVLNSTSLKVTWNIIPNTDVNGYTVCYQLSSPVNCSGQNKTVMGNVNTSVITGLNEATTYYLAAFAFTKKTNGSLGKVENATTEEDSEYLIVINILYQCKQVFIPHVQLTVVDETKETLKAGLKRI